MANFYILGGSPLGLIGVKSRPTQTGESTFNGGDSRNVNVNSYNAGNKQTTSIIQGGENVFARVSLFSGGSLPNFWGNISAGGTDQDTTGLSQAYKSINRSVLHNNQVYDTSILNIIESLSFSKSAGLRPQDFAYLRKLGVYPNNRLMIARRFSLPMRDNIMGKSGSVPLSVLISWKEEGEDFLDFSYGEEWTDSAADFTDVLNKLGENFKTGGMGSGLGKAVNILPLPGFTEILQRKILVELGVLTPMTENSDGEEEETNDIFTAKAIPAPLPSGNPNIIKMAKRRKTIGYGEAGSGLKAIISIKMKVEYEQKFISGIDPTIAWMDILNNALTFGTSNSDNYGLHPKFVKKIDTWTGPGGVATLLDDIIGAFKTVIGGLSDDVEELVQGIIDSQDDTDTEEVEINKKDAEDFLKDLYKTILDSVTATVRKYKVELMGIANALSGMPSTPWHITVGNPLRPIFCSGDMLTQDVKVTMGPTLAFNDLPSTMTVEFTLQNARPLGLQELLSKFNTGYLRVVNVRKDYLVLDGDGKNEEYFDPLTTVPINKGQKAEKSASLGSLGWAERKIKNLKG